MAGSNRLASPFRLSSIIPQFLGFIHCMVFDFILYCVTPSSSTFMLYIGNSLHLARKYARVFARGHYLFREANSFPRAQLEENCDLREPDNVQGQIPQHIFAQFFSAKVEAILLSVYMKSIPLTSYSDASRGPSFSSVVNCHASVVSRLLNILKGKHAISTSPCESDPVTFPHYRRLWVTCGQTIQVDKCFWVDCDRLRRTGDDWFLVRD